MKLVGLFKKSKTKSGPDEGARLKRLSASQSYRGVKISSYYTAARPQSSVESTRRRRAVSPQNSLAKFVRTTISAGGAYVAIGAIVIIAALYSLLLTTEPIVTQSSYFDPSVQSYFKTDEYTALLQGELSSNILNRTKLTLRARDIERSLYQLHPEIATIQVEIDTLGAKPRVFIKTYQPIFALQSGTQRFIVLENGVIVTPVGPVSVKLTVIKDTSQIRLKSGDAFMRQDDARFLSYVVSEVKAQKQWGITSFKLTNRPREVTVRAEGQNYDVKMYLDEDPQQQVGAWFATLKKLGEGSEAPQEYIDVRIGEKVFWK